MQQGGIFVTEKEKSHAGLLYQPGDPELAVVVLLGIIASSLAAFL